jgi:hypothetical protein
VKVRRLRSMGTRTTRPKRPGQARASHSALPRHTKPWAVAGQRYSSVPRSFSKPQKLSFLVSPVVGQTQETLPFSSWMKESTLSGMRGRVLSCFHRSRMSMTGRMPWSSKGWLLHSRVSSALSAAISRAVPSDALVGLGAVEHLDDELSVLDDEGEEPAHGVVGGDGVGAGEGVESTDLPELGVTAELAPERCDGLVTDDDAGDEGIPGGLAMRPPAVLSYWMVLLRR